MSQNRQAEIDRTKTHEDFGINRQAELEIESCTKSALEGIKNMVA